MLVLFLGDLVLVVKMWCVMMSDVTPQMNQCFISVLSQNPEDFPTPNPYVKEKKKAPNVSIHF